MTLSWLGSHVLAPGTSPGDLPDLGIEPRLSYEGNYGILEIKSGDQERY